MKKTALLALAFLGISTFTPASYAAINFLAPKAPDGLATFEQAQTAKSDALDRQIEAKIAVARRLAWLNDDKYVANLKTLEAQAKAYAVKAPNDAEKAKRTYVYNQIMAERLLAVTRILPKEPRKVVEEYVAWNKSSLKPRIVRDAVKNPNQKNAVAMRGEMLVVGRKAYQFALDMYVASGKDADVFGRAVKETVSRMRLDAKKDDVTMPTGKTYSDMRVAFFEVWKDKDSEKLKSMINGIIAEIIRTGDKGYVKIPDPLRPKK